MPLLGVNGYVHKVIFTVQTISSAGCDLDWTTLMPKDMGALNVEDDVNVGIPL
jgi:hypothetical protein